MNTLSTQTSSHILFCCLILFSVTAFTSSYADESVIAGIDIQRLERLDNKLAKHIQQEQYAGFSGIIVRNGKTVHQFALGWQDKERKIALQHDTIFRIYSMTKAITSVAAVLLFEEGHFQIDDPVGAFIPEFRKLRVYIDGPAESMKTEALNRPITFRDLFTHSSGLGYHMLDDSPVYKLYRKRGIMPGVEFLSPGPDDKEPVQDLQTMIKELAKIPLLHQPGKRMTYGVSIDVLGYLIEVISGQSLDNFLQERLFTPLRMLDTGFVVPENKLSRFASNYLWEDEQLKLLDDPRKSRYSKTGRILSGGAGLVSTLDDYMRFLQMLMNGGELDGQRILSPATVDFLLSNHFLKEDLLRPPWMQHQGYSLGFAVALDPIKMGLLSSTGTADWAGAASTFFWLDRKQGLAAVFMTQRTPLNSNTLIMKQVRNLVYQAIVE